LCKLFKEKLDHKKTQQHSLGKNKANLPILTTVLDDEALAAPDVHGELVASDDLLLAQVVKDVHLVLDDEALAAPDVHGELVASDDLLSLFITSFPYKYVFDHFNFSF
jgi:hypothetical protein